MNFEKRITFQDLVGSHGVEGWIIPDRTEIKLQVEKKISVTDIDDIVALRDKLTVVIAEFAKLTGTTFQ